MPTKIERTDETWEVTDGKVSHNPEEWPEDLRVRELATDGKDKD